MPTLSVSEASRRGISKLLSSAQSGEDIVISRHGQVVAEIVSAEEIERLRQDRETLRDAMLIITRIMTDSGARTDLDEVMESFGLSRSELEAELEAELRVL